jgi:glycosyltransferase involved in cell wall biosynthesis
MTAAHPRVLFITAAAFNHVTGGGITFSNLFRGWPKDRIATVHNDPVPVSTDVCERFYRLGASEIDVWPILRRLRPARSDAAVADGNATPSSAHGLLRRVKSLVFGDGLPEHGVLSPELEAWIAEFRPDVIYTILGGTGLMQVIRAVQRRFAVPLVVHFMDDWQSAIHRGGLLSPWQRRRMQRLIADLVGSARSAMGICDAMCEEYEQRFGRPFAPFQNTVDAARWSAIAKSDLRIGSPIRLLYAGSVLSFAQAESLVDCCAAVLSRNAEGAETELEIYSPPAQVAALRERFSAASTIRFSDVIADDEAYFRSLAAADILLLPVNFDEFSIRYIRLSMPTKVPSYLVSGTPVLVYGPAGVAQVEYARDAAWGHVVDQRTAPRLAAAIECLAGDLDLRRRLSAAARRIAAERHDAAVVRRRFQAALAEAARGSLPTAGP